MKKIFLISVILSNIIYADTPSSVIIDGVEYTPVIKKENSQTQTYTIPESSLQGMEDCWYEEVVITEPSSDNVNLVGAVVGGIVGGVIGHQFGSGKGNTAATIGGAALGTAIGGNTNTKPSQTTHTVRKCNILK